MPILRNGSMEEPWENWGNQLDDYGNLVYVFPYSDAPYTKKIDNIKNPPGWFTWFIEGGPYRYIQPEGFLNRYRDPDRMKDGEQGHTIFNFHEVGHHGLMQQIDVEPGSIVTFTAWAHGWSCHTFEHDDDDRWSEGAGYEQIAWTEGSQPGNTGDRQQDAKSNHTYWVGIDPDGQMDPNRDSVVWGKGYHIYNGYVQQLRVQVPARAGTITLFLRAQFLYPFNHNDANWDAAMAVVEPPMEDECRGAPDSQYVRTLVLLPPTETIESRSRWAIAAAASWDYQPRTISPSAQDGGIGDLDVRNVLAVNPIKWGKGEDGRGLGGYYERHYPGVVVREVLATIPADLTQILRQPNEAFPLLAPLKPEPPPPPPVDYPIYRPDNTTGYTSVQILGGYENVGESLQILQPPLVKTVLVHGEFGLVDQYSAHSQFIHRHWNGKEDDFKKCKHWATYADAARAWGAEFIPGLVEDLRSRGLSGTQEKPRRVFLESINETYDYDLNGTWLATRFDLAWILEVARIDALYPDFEFLAAILISAVGNPPLITDPNGEAHWAHLLEMLKVAYDYGAITGQHMYWFADLSRPHLFETLGPYLQFRYRKNDEVMRANGIYLNHFFGETGPCGGSFNDVNGEMWMNPGAGWQQAYGTSDAAWERSLQEFVKFEEGLCVDNARMGDRILGCAHFQAGSRDNNWRPFAIEGRRSVNLSQAIRGLYQ